MEDELVASYLVWRALWKEDQRPFFDGEEEVFARSQLYVALQGKSSLSEVLEETRRQHDLAPIASLPRARLLPPGKPKK